MASSYWVQWEGEAKGPYTIDAVEKLVQRGAVTSETPLRPGHRETWLRAVEIPEVAAVLSAHLPRTAVMPGLSGALPALAPPAPGPRRSPRRLLFGIGAGLGGGLLIVGVVAIGVTVLDREPAFPDAILAEGLPSQVSTLIVIRLPEDIEADDEMRGLRWSDLAVFCGGRDIAKRLIAGHGRSPGELLADGTLDVLRGERLRDHMQCGQRLDAAMGRFHMVFVTFPEGDRQRTIGLMPLRDLADPPFTMPYNFSGLEGRCEPDGESSSECDDDAFALVRRGPWWAFGMASGISAYAREWNRGDERPVTTNMEYARLLAEAVDDAALVAGVYVRPEALPMADMCAHVPGGLGECLPDEVAPTLTRILTRIRAVSTAIKVPDVDHFDPEVGWTMSFAARDESDAEDLSRDLEELLRDWRAHLDNHQASFIETIRAGDDDDADQREAMLRAFIRAMADAEIEVDGRVARLVAEDELSEAEQREVAAQLDRRREIRAAASRVVLAVAAGLEPERSDLNRLVGEVSAAWMLQPRATAEQCDAIRAHIGELSGPGVATEDFGAVFRVRQRFAEGSCAGIVMPTEVASCLTAAQSPTAMDACPLPNPPWRLQPLRVTHQGELTSDDPRVSDDSSPYDDYPVELGAGQTVIAELTSVAFDSYLWLIGPDGSSLAQDDDSGGGTNSRLTYTTTRAGSYVFRANSYDGNGRGPYTLTIRAQAPAL